MSLATQKFNLAEQTELFKINYYKKSENMYNSENVLNGRIKKRYDFTGKQRYVANPLSFSGGVGSGSLPKANGGKYGDSLIEAKRVYARAQIERESIKASANDAGAFVRATSETVKKAVESYMRNDSRILFADGSGALGTIDAGGVTDNGGGQYDVVISAATWQEAKFEEQDFVNVGAGSTELFEIIEVIVASRTVKLQRVSGGAVVPAPADVIFMQGSESNDPQGLDGILQASIAGTGSLYNIPVQRRWSMTFDDASGAGVTTDRMNGLMLDVERKFGKVPNMIMTSYAQYQNILALLEDQKVYNLPNRNIKGNLSFQGVEFMSTRGPIGIFVDRFCQDDRIYFLNDNFIERHHRPDFGWFDDDGTVFLRTADSDDYEARYGGYYENYIVPTAHGCLYGLAV
jgi:hypothetical protein